LIFAETSASAREGDGLTKREWKVNGIAREALLHVPEDAKTKAAAVVFAFHGHGGSMTQAARSFSYHKQWPEAIVVYMQGLPTPGQLTDPEGKRAGWQKGPGDQEDRDLKFFDDVLATLKQELKVDEKRIYSTGHSNGGGFTYLLWATRGDAFAAMAPSGSAAIRYKHMLKPKPMFHVAGENDPLVKFTWQQQMIESVRILNDCGEGQPWEAEKHCTLYPSKKDAPVVTLILQTGHKFPDEAPPLIVKFFKQHALK
jgi:polyhydroxybutyrate depolymerase